MLDLEHSILPAGFSHGYSFQQINEKILVRITLDRGTRNSDVLFEYSPDTNSIFCSLKGQQVPLLCGKLSYPVQDVAHKVEDSQCEITMRKAGGTKSWAMLISDASDRGIDPKSQFLLGIKADAERNFQLAWRQFQGASDAGYFPARLLVADVYASADNPYGVAVDIEKSIGMLSELFEETKRSEIAIKAAKLLVMQERYDDATSILEKALSHDARLMLAELLSPLFGPLNEPERAVEIFEDLARQNHPKAMRRLAKHHTVGCGVPINKNRAKSLLSAARCLDGEEPETIEVSSRWAGFFIGFSVAAVALSVGIGVYTAISKRK